jgi:hypothetical protein
MTRVIERFGIGSVLQPMGLLLLILMFVFQVAVPSGKADASMTSSHAHHQESADAASRCPMGPAELDAKGRGAANLDGSTENAAHCMATMCCFHDTVSPSKLVAVGMLLSSAQIIDRGKAPSSNAVSTQDRPPRHV